MNVRSPPLMYGEPPSVKSKPWWQTGLAGLRTLLGLSRKRSPESLVSADLSELVHIVENDPAMLLEDQVLLTQIFHSLRR